MLAGLIGGQSIDNLSTRLQIPKKIIVDGLTALRLLGLVENIEGTWHAKPGHIHISKDSPFCATNHGNWRNRAVIDSQNTNSDSIHYTSAQTHNAADFDRIKEVFLKALDSTRNIVRPAKNEVATVICLDFFKF